MAICVYMVLYYGIGEVIVIIDGGNQNTNFLHQGVNITKLNGHLDIIECTFNKDISFRKRNTATNEDTIFAECFTAERDCFVLNGTFAENIRKPLYTGHGGIIIIKQLNEDTYGDYTCYETYNTSNEASISIERPKIKTNEGTSETPNKPHTNCRSSSSTLSSAASNVYTISRSPSSISPSLSSSNDSNSSGGISRPITPSSNNRTDISSPIENTGMLTDLPPADIAV
ncbi:uncharacterized protein LOC127870480 isoform X2 [Dreissena polymorpha]|uniref:uncharacterized protein LOC127870480 isoform X2 n=1 Tax=Dreissena polymorpha TaxID=45954 RepID=UPI0022642AD4|nr:uncharacterized protein LOC127870480 isoform X2 [Dreissena polymorpha]